MLGAKTERLLSKWRVTSRWEQGEDPVLTGAIYELPAQGKFAGIAFRLVDGRWWVGIATGEPGCWTLNQAEPLSLRALGYYERWLKRHGILIGHLNERGELSLVPLRRRAAERR